MPVLRALNGRHPKLQEWLFRKFAVQDVIDNAIELIKLLKAQTVAIGCNAIFHRSVILVIIIDERFGANVCHAHLKKKKANSTALGNGHQRLCRKLLHIMRDWELCGWLGLSMLMERAKNWERQGLAADHLEENAAKQHQDAVRLLHCSCSLR
ncbi:hypothetical protein ACUY3M_00705 [Corynebacterium suicordis]